ncbi:cyclopropane-fatty-acyl-phospholipid synthase [Paracoccus halophilus]|uniref:Cyclopropane-fatty-acyl-phospholipid synthase n=1 Tax=Paracoccus halophilus TaxID=376733 RepID=A0A099F2M1_9RHOB|nr:cyclopropane-fatty-acyl-phospholipid synthase family protein [Paracoccus halophilus]KGJ04925.1 cyclopropane-fatty-acyl-phospholipid synthase [Paracoccus halophilus]SFA39127.1 cyclopropane-fatty-acyl-phospholipid synthase [Paracoccus halophilus]
MFERRLRSEFLRSLDGLRFGKLDLTMPDGVTRVFAGDRPGPEAELIIRDWRMVPALAARGDIGLTEAYRDGWCDSPDLAALLTLGLMNEEVLDRYIYGKPMQALAMRLLYLLNRNTRAGSRRNISAHYDLGNDFYQLWLDETMTYSSALFGGPAATGMDDLAAAQRCKYDRIIDGLAGRSGRLLEIGCGWGGFAERALQRGDFAPRGLTLSREQATYARARLGQGAEIALQDYRDEESQFDHIVSIEMFEAVGEKFWPDYFGKLAGALTRNGRAMIQTITVADRYFDRYRRGGDMIRTFIFPGGMLPSPARFRAGAERAGLRVEDAFGFGRDYARTLAQWLDRFDARRAEVRALGFDDAFIRVWRFYLAACIASFSVARTDVVQYRLAHA